MFILTHQIFLYIRIVIKTTREYDKKIISHRYTDFLGNPHE